MYQLLIFLKLLFKFYKDIFKVYFKNLDKGNTFWNCTNEIIQNSKNINVELLSAKQNLYYYVTWNKFNNSTNPKLNIVHCAKHLVIYLINIILLYKKRVVWRLFKSYVNSSGSSKKNSNYS